MVNLQYAVGNLSSFLKFPKWAYSKYKQLHQPPRLNTPAYWIAKSKLNSKNLNVIQIGSNDGKTGDPIFELINRKHNWEVLLVEPVPYLFERLKSNYGSGRRFSFENVAINDGTTQVFYWVSDEAKKDIPNLPVWYDQLGSFNKFNILTHLDGILEPYIRELHVEGITLNKLIERNNIKAVDILHIDTEGYDWKVLSQFDLEKYNPLIILFEYKHLANSEIQGARDFLKNKYNIFQFEGDYLCLRKDQKMLKKDDLNILSANFPLKY